MLSTWYSLLNKPPFLPNPIVFQVVWPILYVLVFLSAILYINNNFNRTSFLPLFLFLLGLFLNFSWSYVFFIRHDTVFALILILFMIVLIVPVIFLFYRKSRVSAYLLIPYFLWLAFALYLNFGIVIKN